MTQRRSREEEEKLLEGGRYLPDQLLLQRRQPLRLQVQLVLQRVLLLVQGGDGLVESGHLLLVAGGHAHLLPWSRRRTTRDSTEGSELI